MNIKKDGGEKRERKEGRWKKRRKGEGIEREFSGRKEERGIDKDNRKNEERG